jgi:hypothetical protein
MQIFQTLQQVKLIVNNKTYSVESNQDKCTGPVLYIWFKTKAEELQEIKSHWRRPNVRVGGESNSTARHLT